MDKAQEYLDHLKRSLALEKEADLQQWQRNVLRMPLSERQSHGYTWQPIQIVKSGFALGDKAYVIVQRPPSVRKDSRFKAGVPVTFYTAAPMVSHPRMSGVVHFATATKMKIILNSPDLPDWLVHGPLGVDLDFDMRSYQEMEKALEKAIRATSGSLRHFRELFSDLQTPHFRPLSEITFPSHLNQGQCDAIQGMLSAQDIAIVHGPPGTGKTTTLAATVMLLVEREQTILVCAASNTATDVLAERLSLQGLNVVRIGHISRVEERLLDLTLDARVAAHSDSKEIKKVKIKAAEARKQAAKYKRTFDSDAREDRKAGYQEARDLEDWARHLENRLVAQILDGAQVIATTLTGAAHPLLEKRSFQTLIVDEAAQALEPAIWIPLAKVKRLILAGDPYQLPPTVKSAAASKAGLSITLMERLIPISRGVHLLQHQYRMHPAIMAFSNSWFYNEQLIAAPGLEHQLLSVNDNLPLLFIDTAGCGFEEKINPETQSRYNPDEYVLITCHLENLRHDLVEKPWPEIALLSPYREQVEYLEENLLTDPRYQDLPITIQTIDGFQGQEMDVVILSLVRSNTDMDIGFLRDYRRMNVAMTRARLQLVIIGDSATIGQDPFFQKFLTHCETTGAWRSAWEYIQ